MLDLLSTRKMLWQGVFALSFLLHGFEVQCAGKMDATNLRISTILNIKSDGLHCLFKYSWIFTIWNVNSWTWYKFMPISQIRSQPMYIQVFQGQEILHHKIQQLNFGFQDLLSLVAWMFCPLQILSLIDFWFGCLLYTLFNLSKPGTCL